ncbi:MAG TPA: hypothetical protein VLB04_06380 [Methanotrichaceae archaeon]|nr:hypothetical protein [Methanotrichaceae archaeon]
MIISIKIFLLSFFHPTTTLKHVRLVQELQELYGVGKFNEIISFIFFIAAS